MKTIVYALDSACNHGTSRFLSSRKSLNMCFAELGDQCGYETVQHIIEENPQHPIAASWYYLIQCKDALGSGNYS